MVSGFANSIFAGDLPAMAGWCRGNIPVLSSGAVGSIPAPAPIFKRRGVDRICSIFLIVLIVVIAPIHITTQFLLVVLIILHTVLILVLLGTIMTYI